MKKTKLPLEERLRRARAYVGRYPHAVEGQGGDKKTYVLACSLVNGFCLPPEAALSVLREWNKTCAPPWSEGELIQKIENALKYGRENEAPPPMLTSTPDDEDGEDKSTATRIVEICKDFELFHSQERQPYATFSTRGHRETHEIESKDFEHYVTGLFFKLSGRAPGAAMGHALEVLSAKARFDGPKRTVYTRIKVQQKCEDCEGCETCESVVIDLGDDQWSSLILSRGGWAVQGDTSVKFRRSGSTRALPTPVRGGDPTRIFEFLNLGSDSDRHLVLVWLVSVLVSRGPSPILIMQGQQGSAKSFSTRLLKQLVDPSIPPIRTLSRDERDLAIASANNWVLTFDNLSGLQPSQSDALCRIVTGGGLGTRSLYTNNEEFIFDVRRPVILNGIDDIATRPDLLDRSIVLNLPVIDGIRRKTEEEILVAFTQAHPEILGGLLDLSVEVLNKINGVTLPSAPRMADYAKIGTAYEQVIGMPPGQFVTIFNSNRQDAIENEMDKDLVAQAVMELVENSPNGWSGSLTELHNRIRDYVAHMSPGFERTVFFPQNSQALSNRLKRLSPHLRSKGFEIVWAGREGGTGRSKILLRMVQPTDPSAQNQKAGASSSSQSSQSSQMKLIGINGRPVDFLGDFQ